MKDLREIAKVIMSSDYNYFGIRHCTDDENYNVGDTCRNWYAWEYEYDRSTFDTDEPIELNGACALDTHINELFDDDEDEIIEKLEKVLKASDIYCGNAILIASDYTEYGMDDDEIIMENAVVLAKLD